MSDQKSSRSLDCCTGVSGLPCSLISHILVKLPIKSIIICKCVCKSWNHLIVDPFFTNLDSNYSPYTTMLLFQQLSSCFLQPATFSREIYSSFLQIQNNTPFPFHLNDTVGTTNVKRIFTLIGSCNGLLRLVDQPICKLINPLTGQSRILSTFQRAAIRFRNCYGFGVTVDGDCYKLVRLAAIIYVDVNGARRVRLESKVFTVGVGDEWRDFHTPYGNFSSNGVALNGFLHWVDHNKSDSNSIYAFDVGKEIGHYIASPLCVGGGFLGVWDGRLCVTKMSQNGLQLDIWTMMEYGVGESWTKDVILISSISSANIYQQPILRATRRNGDMLLSFVSSGKSPILISFDPKTKNCVKLEGGYADEDRSGYLQEYAPCFSSLSVVTPG